MDSCGFFINLMHSLDAAFLARQGALASHGKDWGERFFQALDWNHPKWTDHTLPIYMKACEILNYFAALGRADEIGPAIYEKPETLLAMVLMLLRCDGSDPSSAELIEKEERA
jgi:hypothetical protein